jgi:hypothetical protein
MLGDDILTEVGTIFNDFGKSVTYVPSDPVVLPFSISAVFGRVQYDELDRHFMRDLCECKILHSALVAHGVTTPTMRSQKSQGDTINGTDQNGSAVTWSVVDMLYELGLWILTLEKNVRIVA